MPRAGQILPLGFLAAGLALSGCSVPFLGGGDEKIVVPGEVTVINCPDQLVHVNLPKRPTSPKWGDGKSDLADEATYATRLEAYTDALEREKAAREKQIAECKPTEGDDE